jgi:sirohydrochlorin ferrochelatase
VRVTKTPAKARVQPRRAILLVDHGSVRAEANEMLRAVARLVAREAPQFHVEVAHMELARPTIAEGFAACAAVGANDVTVCPYLLAPGRHSTADIPRLAAAAARRHPGVTFRVSEPLGIDPRLARVVIERVEEASVRSGRGHRHRRRARTLPWH